MPTKYRPVSSEDVELESHFDAPLLDLEPLEDDALNDNDTFHSHTEPVPSYRFSRWGVRSPKRIVILISFIKFAVVFSGMLLLLPTARLVEDMFCHIHYEDTSVDIIDEMKCKVDEVQSQLGYLYGWNSLITSLIGEYNSELAHSQKTAVSNTIQALSWPSLMELCPTRLAASQQSCSLGPVSLCVSFLLLSVSKLSKASFAKSLIF
jgi:hypothetical protein